MGYIGTYWSHLKDRFPSVKHGNRIPPKFERFGLNDPIQEGQVQFQILNEVTVPRVIFISEEKDRSLQIQDDLMVYNWKKISESNEYPRFEKLGSEVKGLVSDFEEFIKSNKLYESDEYPGLVINQIEVTNVNEIEIEGRSVNQVFNGLNCGVETLGDSVLESYHFNLRHKLKYHEQSIGRIHTRLEIGKSSFSEKLVFRLTLTARSNPLSIFDSDGDLMFLETLDFLRKEINLAFKNISTIEMHDEWGLKNEKS